MGIIAGQDIDDVLGSLTTGFGTTGPGVGALLALGAMFTKLPADSGGADQIVDTIVNRSSARLGNDTASAALRFATATALSRTAHVQLGPVTTDALGRRVDELDLVDEPIRPGQV